MGEKSTLSQKIRVAFCFPVAGMLVIAAMGLAGVSNAVIAVSAVALAAIAVLVATVVARQIRAAVGTVAEQARQIAEELPSFTQAVRDGRLETAPTLEGVNGLGDEDLDSIARSINLIGGTATDQAADFGDLARQGVGDVFISIMRRNQELLDRQMAHIDRLEAGETDPDRLENLFTIDHLTTRIRRNSDSLLVLAGHGQPQPVDSAVPLHDVLRVAQAEVANFEIVDIRSVPDVMVSAGRAASLAHMVAELLENATEHAGEQSVAVDAEQQGETLRVSIIDGGPGMSQGQIDEINSLLEDPPPVGLASSKWVGFNVVSRLANRLDAQVRLVAGAESGLIAWIEVPTVQLLQPSRSRPSEGATSNADEAESEAISFAEQSPGDADELHAGDVESELEVVDLEIETDAEIHETIDAEDAPTELPSRSSLPADLDSDSDWTPGHTGDELPSRSRSTAPITSDELDASSPEAVPNWLQESSDAPADYAADMPQSLDEALSTDFDGLPSRGTTETTDQPAVPALGASRRERNPEDVRSILSRYQRKDTSGTEGESNG